MKTLTADKVKRLAPGTDVFLVDDDTGRRGRGFVLQKGKKKVLRLAFSDRDMKIEDRPGWHYEVEE